jgi:hypothetical protein
VLDGEAFGVDGIFDFNALHSGKHDDEVQLCAFDILVEGGDDLRKRQARGRPYHPWRRQYPLSFSNAVCWTPAGQ